MVHLEDLGSHFDAPLDTVWKFLQSPDDHGRSHAGRRNIQGAPDGPDGMRLSWEQHVEGNWVKVANRVTMFPPVAMLVHSVEGPLAGSKFMMYYRPDGARTVVNVVGDFQSKMIPPAQLQAMVLASLEEAYNEDNASLKRLVART
ncbi:MAG TPA: hypothetical protein VMH90_04590 [Thermoplasmata archaeon]|nr:hypothetical protein [Thermoplasmata archaeon]